MATKEEKEAREYADKLEKKIREKSDRESAARYRATQALQDELNDAEASNGGYSNSGDNSRSDR